MAKIPFGKVTSCILFILWAMGDPHIQIWHWIVPYAFDVICNLPVPTRTRRKVK